MDFRPAYQALAARFETDLAGVVRRVTRQNLPAKSFPDQPAMVVLEEGMVPYGEDDDGRPIGHELGALLVLHVQPGGTDVEPGDVVLDLIAKVRAALLWRVGEPQGEGQGYWSTLGGAVLLAKLEEVAITDDIANVSQVSIPMRVTMRVSDE